MILFLIVCGLVLYILYNWITMIIDAKRCPIPGPFPLPIVGNGHLFLGSSAHFLKALSQLAVNYNDAVRFHILSERYLHLSHPKYFESIMSSTEMITKGRSYYFIQPWLGQGLLTSTGNRWKTHRKFLTPAFHYTILQTFLPIFVKNDKILIKKLRALADGTSINLLPIVALAALDNVTETIMGVSVNAQKDSRSAYVMAIESLSEVMALRMRNPFVSEDAIFNLLPLKSKQDKALKVLHGYTNKVIDARREELKRLNITTLGGNSELGLKNTHAFLDLLLLSEIDGNKIDNESVREEVDTFMFEGHDTTTSGIVYALLCLSKHEDIQEKIFEEQKTIFGDDMERDPTFSELQQMKYLELVIKESLRLYPPVPMIERLIMRDTDIGGIRVLKDTTIVINILHMHRHPDIYENPLEFIPERFQVTKTKNPYDWLAFSAGPRNCIGQKFAMLEMKVAIASVIKHFKILPTNIEPELNADLILRSLNGVHVKLLPRP